MATVGTAWVEIVPSARGFGRRLQSEIGGDVSTAGRVGGGAYGDQFGDEAGRRSKSRFAGVFSALKGAGVLAAAAAGAAVGKVLVDSIETASDFSETQAKASQIFGADQLPALQEFADGAAESLGQSKQAALDSATTFGVFGKSAGKTGTDLVDFSTQMTTLSSDLASFGNTTPEEATEALGAALRGEAEPIRKYGVLLDDATLRQRALKDGLIETTSQALTPQQRVLAAQSEILSQTKDAQGDFARTSGGLANQQRILTAQWENAKVAIGTVLLPIVTRFFRYVNSTAIPAIKGFVEGFKNLRRSGGDASGFVGVALGALRKLVGYFRGNFAMVKTIVRDALELVKVIWERYGDIIIRTVRGLFNGIKDVVRGGMRIIRGIIKVVTGVLSGDWRKAWSGLKDIVKGVFQVLRGMIRGAMALLKGLLQAGWRTMKTITSSAWNGLKDVVKNGIDRIVDGVRALPGRIRALGGLLKAAGKAIIDQLVDGMKNAAGVVSGIAGNVWDAVKGMLNSALSQIDSALSFSIRLPGKTLGFNPDIPRLATGTNFHRGGLALVGEEGPELVSMPRGTKVTPHGKSMQMLSGRGPVPLTAAASRGGLSGPVTLRVGEYEMQAWFEQALDAEMALD